MTEKNRSKDRDELSMFIQTDVLPSEAADDGGRIELPFEELLQEPSELGDTEDILHPNLDYPDMDEFEDAWTESEEEGVLSEIMEGEDLYEGNGGAAADDDTPAFEGSWFVSEPEVLPADDGGREGPAGQEIFEVDESGWVPLTGEDESVEGEDVFASMARMDISLLDYDAAVAGTAMLEALDISVSFLGPSHSVPQVAVFYRGRPVAAGEHLFVQGADGRLYPLPEENAEALTTAADSLVPYGEALFAGTAKRGALMSEDSGRSWSPINSWYTAGFAERGGVRAEKCSTSFSLSGHLFSGGFRLFGLTGEGQLFVSVDRGVTWQGPMLKGCCSAPAVSSGSSSAWLWSAGPGEEMTFYETKNGVVGNAMPLPGRLRDKLTPGGARAAAGRGGPVVYELHSSLPAFASEDNGAKWREIPSWCNLTALMLSATSDGFDAAGVTAADGSAQVLISLDGGRSCREVLVVPPTAETPAQTVYSLVGDEGGRCLLAATSAGVYLIESEADEITH